MKKHIAKQMKGIRQKLISEFDSNPFMGDHTYTIRRENTMVCEDFDALLSEMVEAWETKIQNHLHPSDWTNITTFSVESSILNDEMGEGGLPMEWEVSVNWETEAFNLFDF